MTMVNPQRPDEWDSLLAGYVLGDLTPEEVARVKEHLESDVELADEVRRLQATLALLPLSLPETIPPPTLRHRLMQAAATYPPTHQVNRQIWRHPLTLFGVLGSAAAVLIAGLGFTIYNLHQQLAGTQAELSRYQQAITLLRQPDNRLMTLKPMNSLHKASGSLVIVPTSQAAILTVKNLPPLPKTKVYRLWAFVNGKKVDCAQFNPDSQGKVFLQLPLDNFLANAVSVAITIEPSKASPQPTGETVIMGHLWI